MASSNVTSVSFHLAKMNSLPFELIPQRRSETNKSIRTRIFQEVVETLEIKSQRNENIDILEL